MTTGMLGRPPVDLLVVDDDRIFLTSIAERLRVEPAVGNVEAVLSSEDAWACLRRHSPDVVLLDFNLADGSSLPLLADIRSLTGHPIVLMLSGSENVADIVLAIDSGADGWIGKGASVSDVLDAIDRAMDGELVLPPYTVGKVVRFLLAELHRRETSA